MVLLQDEEPFNPDYVEVDRILDVSHSVDKDNGEVLGKNLVNTLVLQKRVALPFFSLSVSYFFTISKVTLIKFLFFPFRMLSTI